jgi:hypothetical protein
MGVKLFALTVIDCILKLLTFNVDHEEEAPEEEAVRLVKKIESQSSSFNRLRVIEDFVVATRRKERATAGLTIKHLVDKHNTLLKKEVWKTNDYVQKLVEETEDLKNKLEFKQN